MAKKVPITKVLSCFVVFVILMSAVPVSTFAMNGDNNASSNVSNSSNETLLEKAFTEKSFAEAMMPFLADTTEQKNNSICIAQTSASGSSLTVNVYNIDKRSLPPNPGTIRVKLLEQEEEIVTTTTEFEAGTPSASVTFYNIPPSDPVIGGIYRIAVSQIPHVKDGQQEYWGAKGGIFLEEGSNTIDFVRFGQWISDIRINGKNPWTDEITVDALEEVSIDITVKNDGLDKEKTYVELYLDHDTDPDHYYDFRRFSSRIPIEKEDSYTFHFDYTPQRTGTYYFYILVFWRNVIYPIIPDCKTDQHEWYKAFTVIGEDTTNPFASISINNGAESTNSRSVTLYLSYSDATSGVKDCGYKNEGELWASWESCSLTKSWTLTAGEGTKKVYYQVRDNAGNIKEVYDTIVLKQKGSIYATSNPSSANVYLDGTDKGTSPIRIPNVPVGSHTVKYTKSGYYDCSKVVTVNADQQTNVHCDLEITTPTTIVFEDNFDEPNLNNWIPFGSPSPRVLASAEGRTGVFDNNGDGWCNSGVVSKDNFSFPNGCTMESDIYLDVTNVAGCWNSPVIGLTRQNKPTGEGVGPTEDYPMGVIFGIEYDGDACWGTPEEKRRHAYFNIGLYTEDGTWESVSWLNADDYTDAWHNFKIAVGSDRIVKFYVDNELIYTSMKRINETVLQEKKIFLGIRSSGSAGKSYHDYIKVYHEAVGPPSIEKVVLTSDRSGNWDIWMMNLDGTDLEQLTTDPTNDDFPQISPDAKKIVFCSDRTGTSQVWMMNSDGSDQHQLFDIETLSSPYEYEKRVTFAKWSPDGSYIITHVGLWGVHSSPWSVIYRHDPDGSNPRIFLDYGPSVKGGFDISSDGNKFVYCREDSNYWAPTLKICVADIVDGVVDKSSIRELSSTKDGYADKDVIWFCNDTKIMWRKSNNVNGYSTPFNLYSMNGDETNIIKLTHYAGDQGAYEPDFSPGGQKVVFRISNSTTVGLYAMNPDGSDIKPLLVDEYKNKNPCWGIIMSLITLV